MNARVLPVDSLTAGERAAMLALLERSFRGVTADTFHADLADKTHALLLHDDAGTPVGFTTLAVYPAPAPESTDASGSPHTPGSDAPTAAPCTVVCSGDTIVAPEAWGRSALARTWINAVLRLGQPGTATADRDPDAPPPDLYWLLICSGFRTYRFLPVFFRRFVAGPVTADAHTEAAPDDTGGLHRFAHRLAAARWGERFDPAAGIVRLAHPQRLRPGLVDVPPGRAGQPDVAAFLRLNPGHAAGDELVCLTRLHRDNLTRAGRRMLDAGTPSPLPSTPGPPA